MADIDSEMKEVLDIPHTDLQEVSADKRVDVYFRRGDDEYYVDIKTRGNKGMHLNLKAQLLEWVARANKPIHPIIAVPYNPYEPERYRGVGVQVMQLGKICWWEKNFGIWLADPDSTNSWRTSSRRKARGTGRSEKETARNAIGGCATGVRARDRQDGAVFEAAA